MESLADSRIDVIKKPRTLYSKSVLRMAVPNVNIQQKKESITMNKLRVLTFLNPTDRDEMNRKVKTVDNIPKILTIVANDRRKGKGGKLGSKFNIGDHHSIKEKKDEDDSRNEMDDRRSDDDGSSNSGSSIDGDLEEDDQKLFADINVIAA